MNKVLLFFCLIFFVLRAHADELTDAVNNFGKTLSTVITQQTDGYVSDEMETDYGYSVFINLPSYFDNELIITTINPILKDGNFKTLKPWTKIEDGLTSAYVLENAAKLNLRFNQDRHHLVLLLQPVRE